ncbi:Leukocyte cell-derived chemotaxin-2 [Anabarilius grahami]|uniref:Leukocyte cell-derived chemotaxin-2 n=1 Tax=Anabarilius grahami TaxID=495550 RepID=A0A3N0Z058_ANAGA|nr:Leukocyte cell-derived chemotaxin-2 [Anabarilius grahami]
METTSKLPDHPTTAAVPEPPALPVTATEAVPEFMEVIPEVTTYTFLFLPAVSSLFSFFFFLNGGNRKHMGLDITCSDGNTVYAPFDVKLNGRSIPYSQNNAINDGINLSGQGLCFKLFYVKPDRYSGTLKKGQRIGRMLPMQRVYPGITSHVHVQMCDRSDPTKYF